MLQNTDKQPIPFQFIHKDELQLSPFSIIFEIPGSLKDKEALMDAYAKMIIEEDSYFFARTWDGLSDMLEDLGWIPDELEDIVLAHSDIPATSASDRKIYIDILSDIVDYWRVGEGIERKVIVQFPPETKDEVLDILHSEEHFEQEYRAGNHRHGGCCHH